jgi:hypothetical protein
LIARLTDGLDKIKSNWWSSSVKSPLQLKGAEVMKHDAFMMLVDHRREISGGGDGAGSNWQLARGQFLDRHIDKLITVSDAASRVFEVLVFGFVWGKLRTLSALRHMNQAPNPPQHYNIPQPGVPTGGTPHHPAAPVPTYHANPQVQQQIQQHLTQQQPHLQQPHPHQAPHGHPQAQPQAQRIAAYAAKNWKGALSTRHGVFAAVGSLMVYTILEIETLLDGKLWVPNSQLQVGGGRNAYFFHVKIFFSSSLSRFFV